MYMGMPLKKISICRRGLITLTTPPTQVWTGGVPPKSLTIKQLTFMNNSNNSNTAAVLVNAVRSAEKDGKTFMALDLIQIKPVLSKTSNKYYLGAIKASITTALSKEVAERLVGTELGGTIITRALPEDKHRNWVNPRTQETILITQENVWVAE